MSIPEGWVGKKTENTFDIIVYVDQHGGCVYDPTTKSTDDVYGVNYNGVAHINLSIMRAGEFGISVRGDHRHLFLLDTTRQLMSRDDHSKDTVFNGLQQMFRHQKTIFKDRKSSVPPGMTPFLNDRLDEMFDKSDGWNYTIDGSTFVNTYYSTDESFNTILILYDANPENIGLSIILKHNNLADLVEGLRYQGYKNIGIIENTCRYIKATPRQVVMIRKNIENKYSGAMGGRKRMRITRKANKRKRMTRK